MDERAGEVRTQWLQCVRGDWRVCSPKAIFKERREPSRIDDVHLTPSQMLGVIPQQEYMDLTGTKVVLNLTGADNMKHVEVDDFIIHLRSFQGGIEHSRYPGKVSNAYTVFTPGSGVEPRYFRWVLKSQGFIQELQATTEQLRDGQSIKFEQFNGIGLPVPPLDEERRIADFLDDQVARIDRIRAARLREADLLLEAQRSRWGEFVDGLYKATPVTSIGRLLRCIEQGSSPNGGGAATTGELAVLRTSAIKDGQFFATENKALLDPADFDPRYEVRTGDVLVVRGSGSGELVADSAVAELSSESPRIMLSDLVYRLRGLELDAAWTVAILQSPQARSQIRTLVRQGSGPAKARGADIKAIRVPVLKQEMQLAAAQEYWSDRDRVSSGRRAIEDCLTLLEEYKRSLITAAVTGQFDVTAASGRGVPA